MLSVEYATVQSNEKNLVRTAFGRPLDVVRNPNCPGSPRDICAEHPSSVG